MRIKENKLLREWIRISLTEGLLTENRGDVYEKTLENALNTIPGFKVMPGASNNNTISDLGINFYGTNIAAEVKLNHEANLGAVSKETIETLTFDASTDTFNYTVKSDPFAQQYKDIIKTAIGALNAGTGPAQMRKLTDAVRKPAQPIDLADEIVLMGTISKIGKRDKETGRTPAVDEFAKKWAEDPGGMANWITPAMKTDIFFRVLKDEQDKSTASAERLAQIGLSPEHVAAGFKTLSQVSPGLNKTLMNAPVLTAAEVRKIMTRKKGPNGADTDYLITGRDDENSVSGEIHHIGTDVLGLGTDPFEPPSANLEVRLKGGGSATKGTGTYGVQFSTKAEPGPAGLKFKDAEALAAIFANSRVAKSQDDDLKSKLKSELIPKSSPDRQPADSRSPIPTTMARTDQGRIDRETRRDPYANLSASLKRAVLKRLLREAQKN